MGMDFTRFLVILGSATLLILVVSGLAYVITYPIARRRNKAKSDKDRLEAIEKKLDSLETALKELRKGQESQNTDGLYSNRSLDLKLEDIYNKLLEIEAGLETERYVNGTSTEISRLVDSGPSGIDDDGKGGGRR